MGKLLSMIIEQTRARSKAFMLAALLALPLASGLGCRQPENCNDGLDNDFDNFTDCDDKKDCSADPKCVVPPEVCDDAANADEDGDGNANCADNDCAQDPTCQEVCSGGVDEDLDGNIDCADDDCAADPVCLCGNGQVDGTEQCDGTDLNNKDCSDQGFDIGNLACNPNCTFNVAGCANNGAEACGNGLDDDGDGDIDCADQECVGNALCQEACVGGVDEDLDGDIDCADNDCAANPVCQENCNGGVDEDLDGQIDCADADCLTDPVCQESCTGGIDEDLDGKIDCVDNDCAADPACLCGNGQINGGEQCDGANLNSQSCTTQGFDSGNLACNANCSFNLAGCLNDAETCGNGVDDDNDGQIDCKDIVGCATDPACDTPATSANVVGAGFSGALAVAISNNGATAFFTGYNAADKAAVFSVSTAGGAATQLFAGAPLSKPTGLALSPDGSTLFIADLASGANEAGSVFSMSVGGGTPVAIAIANVLRPSAIAVSDNGNTLFVGGAQAANGITGVFSVGVGGGNATLLSTLNDPAALAVAGNQVLAVEAVSANHRASVVKIPAAGGAPTVLAAGLRIDYPAGISSLVDNNTVLFSAVDPLAVNYGGAIFKVGINGGAVTFVDVGTTFVSAGSLARARNNNSFAIVDTEAGATVSGAILRVQ